jgi:hypothetical protein
VKRRPGGHTPVMAIKDIIGSLLGRGRSQESHPPSGSPHTVGAPKPGEAGAPRSATSSARDKAPETPRTGGS